MNKMKQFFGIKMILAMLVMAGLCGCATAATNVWLGDQVKTTTVKGSNYVQMAIQRVGTSGTGSNGLWRLITAGNFVESLGLAYRTNQNLTNISLHGETTIGSYGMLWYDTSTDVLMISNSFHNTWIALDSGLTLAPGATITINGGTNIFNWANVQTNTLNLFVRTNSGTAWDLTLRGSPYLYGIPQTPGNSDKLFFSVDPDQNIIISDVTYAQVAAAVAGTTLNTNQFVGSYDGNATNLNLYNVARLLTIPYEPDPGDPVLFQNVAQQGVIVPASTITYGDLMAKQTGSLNLTNWSELSTNDMASTNWVADFFEESVYEITNGPNASVGTNGTSVFFYIPDGAVMTNLTLTSTTTVDVVRIGGSDGTAYMFDTVLYNWSMGTNIDGVGYSDIAVFEDGSQRTLQIHTPTSWIVSDNIRFSGSTNRTWLAGYPLVISIQDDLGDDYGEVAAGYLTNYPVRFSEFVTTTNLSSSNYVSSTTPTTFTATNSMPELQVGTLQLTNNILRPVTYLTAESADSNFVCNLNVSRQAIWLATNANWLHATNLVASTNWEKSVMIVLRNYSGSNLTNTVPTTWKRVGTAQTIISNNTEAVMAISNYGDNQSNIIYAIAVP